MTLHHWTTRMIQIKTLRKWCYKPANKPWTSELSPPNAGSPNDRSVDQDRSKGTICEGKFLHIQLTQDFTRTPWGIAYGALSYCSECPLCGLNVILQLTTSELSLPYSSLPHVTTDPSARIAAKAPSIAWSCCTFLNWSWIAELSPPEHGLPHATADPSSKIAANANHLWPETASCATPWHWLIVAQLPFAPHNKWSICQDCGKDSTRHLKMFDISQLILYLWAVPTPIWIAPCHNRSIGQECSKCKFGRLYRFNISQLILHTRALTTRSGWHTSSPEPVRLLSIDPAPVQLAGFSGGPGHGHLWEALRRPAPMRSWWKSSSPRLWRISEKLALFPLGKTTCNRSVRS